MISDGMSAALGVPPIHDREWLDGDGCELIVRTSAGPLLHIPLHHLEPTLILGGGVLLAYHYRPVRYRNEVDPDDVEDQDEAPPSPKLGLPDSGRRYVVLRLAEHGRIHNSPDRPFAFELVPEWLPGAPDGAGSASGAGAPG